MAPSFAGAVKRLQQHDNRTCLALSNLTQVYLPFQYFALSR